MKESLNPIIALVTPFSSDGAINWPIFSIYLKALESWGVRSVITNGTTGEFASLTLGERQQSVEYVRSNFKGHIINNVSATCLEDVKDLIAGCSSFADAILLLPPYYYSGIDQGGLFNFFVAALKDSPLPVYLYNYPRHTGNSITLELFKELRNADLNIIGIKDSSGDLNNAVIYKQIEPHCEIYLGSDEKALEALQNGLTGSVTGGGNALPEFLITISNLYKKGDPLAAEVQDIFNNWNSYRKSLSIAEIPVIKASIAARIPDFPLYVRPPFVSVNEVQKREIIQKVNNCMNNLKGKLDN